MPEDERPRPNGSPHKALSKEKTILGTGALPEKEKSPAKPIVASLPKREKTVIGMGPSSPAFRFKPPVREVSQQEPPPEGWDLPEPAARTREPSIAVDLSELDSSAVDLVAAKPTRAEPSLVPAGLPRRRGLVWRVVLVALLAGAAAYGGYRQRSQLVPLLNSLELRLSTMQMPAGLRFWR
jgi:hypothetical protein